MQDPSPELELVDIEFPKAGSSEAVVISLSVMVSELHTKHQSTWWGSPCLQAQEYFSLDDRYLDVIGNRYRLWYFNDTINCCS